MRGIDKVFAKFYKKKLYLQKFSQSLQGNKWAIALHHVSIESTLFCFFHVLHKTLLIRILFSSCKFWSRIIKKKKRISSPLIVDVGISNVRYNIFDDTKDFNALLSINIDYVSLLRSQKVRATIWLYNKEGTEFSFWGCSFRYSFKVLKLFGCTIEKE